MTTEQEYIIKLSRAAIYNEEPEEPPADIDWNYIWNKAAEQNISGLLASAILRIPEEKQVGNREAWQEIMFETMFVMGKNFAEFKRMMSLLKNNGITPVCLKGIVLKDLYPTPELRTMGDFDIWVETEQRESVEEIFSSAGYSIQKRPFFTETDGNNTHWEIFDTLEQEFRKNPDIWNKRLWENTYINKNGLRTLKPEYHLAYMIIHMEKHFTWCGCGIRNMVDVAIFLCAYPKIDMNLVENLCREKEVEKFYLYVMNGIKTWFCKEILNNYNTGCAKDDFMEHFLEDGIFGFDMPGSSLKIMQSQKNVNFIRALFPTLNELKWQYMFLEKKRWLLPAAWIHRLLKGAIAKKNSPLKMIRDYKKHSAAIKSYKERLEKLGLERHTQNDD